MKKIKIRILRMPDFGGSSHKLYCEMVLGLKIAREAGDIDYVPQSRLKYLKLEGVEFEKVD